MTTTGTGTENIRRLNRDDLSAVLALDRRISKKRHMISYKDMMATDPTGALDISYICETHGRVIGCIIARLEYMGVPLSEVCFIHGILVEPDYQNRGIGTRLINVLLDHCNTERISPVRALLNKRDAKVKRFFERLDFKKSNLVNYDRKLQGASW